MSDYPKKPVEELRPGDVIDLQGDPYADPPGNEFAAWYECELVEVASVERETPDCTVVGIEGGPGLIGFPAGHELPVRAWTI